MSTAAPSTLDRLWSALAEVMDPEIPAVSVLDMGMIKSIEQEPDGRVRVEVLPTFSGCPALDIIETTIRERLEQESGAGMVEVRFVFDPVWSSDRITEEGRRRLQTFGIAPAPLLRGKALTVLQPAPVACPYCGSHRSVLDNLFGPTPCRSLFRCLDCRNPFEAFKAI